ncbi:MAG: penicillin-binding transpeptidase domain-containing protein, partial [Gammaproteobacteria bacterium]
EASAAAATDAVQPLPPVEMVPPEARDWDPAPRAIDPKTIWMISDMMHDVTVRGTAAKVAELGRSDLAGKTGTTNDETDAWFNGFQRELVAVVWVGFDQPAPLGRGEVGGKAALPAWMDFMRVALDGVPEASPARPPGLVNVRINPDTGRLATVGDPDAIFETVPQERVPEPDAPLQERRREDRELQDLF